MGVRRNKGIGMNRTKKAKPTPVEPAAVEPESEDESDDAESQVSPSLPEPALSPAQSLIDDVPLWQMEIAYRGRQG